MPQAPRKRKEGGRRRRASRPPPWFASPPRELEEERPHRGPSILLLLRRRHLLLLLQQQLRRLRPKLEGAMRMWQRPMMRRPRPQLQWPPPQRQPQRLLPDPPLVPRPPPLLRRPLRARTTKQPRRPPPLPQPARRRPPHLGPQRMHRQQQQRRRQLRRMWQRLPDRRRRRRIVPSWMTKRRMAKTRMHPHLEGRAEEEETDDGRGMQQWPQSLSKQSRPLPLPTMMRSGTGTIRPHRCSRSLLDPPQPPLQRCPWERQKRHASLRGSCCLPQRARTTAPFQREKAPVPTWRLRQPQRRRHVRPRPPGRVLP
jgi:hypothetical protein